MPTLKVDHDYCTECRMCYIVCRDLDINAVYVALEPLHRIEIVWITIAFLWGLVMFSAMVFWHLTGQQNLSNEAYRTTPEIANGRRRGGLTWLLR